MDAKPVSASLTTISVVALPRDSNFYGVVYGGTVMALIDDAAYATAVRHARQAVVTVGMDHLYFRRSINIGDIIIVKAAVNYVGRTSMEIGVRVETERLPTGDIEHIGSAYLTMVALGPDGTPRPVPPLLLESDEERRRHREAEARRAQRLASLGRTTEPPHA